jgi:hypothetical protein
LRAFLSDDLRSKPIGFYTWSDSLSTIFRHDRLLQTELKGSDQIAALIDLLAREARLNETYAAYLRLVSLLTNPFPSELRPVSSVAADEDAPGEGVYFFPPSRAHETELMTRLYGDKPIPEGFSLVEELIARIRRGEIDLTPSASSGWYDVQTFALETLVMPEKAREASRLEFEETYRNHLLDLFRGLLALTRETHIKQLQVPMEAAAMPPPTIDVHPELSAEPLATYYLRRSASYRFIRTVLEEALGTDALRGMNRLTADGPVRKNLDAELSEMEGLFYGAYSVVCAELGLEPDLGPLSRDPQGDGDRFRSWLKSVWSDVDVGADARMMVPVFYDLQRKKTKVWVFMGWSERPLDISFAKKPDVTVLDEDGREVEPDQVQLSFYGYGYRVAYPVMAEVYVTEILDRKEFRAHCDRFKTRAGILENLR